MRIFGQDMTQTKFPGEQTGAPNDQFVVKCIIIPQLMKINVIKAFSGVFQCCWEIIICSFFPARHTRNFPASWIKLVGFPASWSNLFPSQEFHALSNPSIRNDRTKATKAGQNRFFPHAQSLWPAVVCLWLLSGKGKGFFSFFFFFFFCSRPQSSEFLQPARVEMLEKVSNSQAKPLSITKFPSQLIETPVFLPASKISLWNR